VVTAAGRVVCRAVGTTAWAVLAGIGLDTEADAHGNLVAVTNVRRIAGDLGISKDTAARALSRLVDAGLVVRHCRRGAGGHFVRSLYEVRLDPDAGVTVVAPTPCPTSPCPVLGDTLAGRPAPSAASGLKQCARPDRNGPGPRRPPPGQEAVFELGTEAMEHQ
jgi:DNA-binding transcriptional ArsR family regulator